MTTIHNMNLDITRDSSITRTSHSGSGSSAFLHNIVSNNDALWKSAIDEMLLWKSDPNYFEPEDSPSEDVLESAIDFAYDQLQENGPAPSSIIPSGSGYVSIEWNDASSTVIVEFIGLGLANLCKFNGHKLISKELLKRNPLSRKLELRG